MFKESLLKALRTFRISLPMIIGILLLISLINPIISNYYDVIFTGNYFLDPIIGAIARSIAFGIPITAYVVGGKLLSSGVSLLGVTAFIMAWTTVGLAMLPLEIKFLGKKFAIVRNLLNFVLAIIIAVLTIFTMGVLV
jgi:hypothetical protein